MAHLFCRVKTGCLLPVIWLILACSADSGRSPVGDSDEFRAKPLDIYVEVGAEDSIFRFPEAEVVNNGDVIAGTTVDSVRSFPLWSPLTNDGPKMQNWGMYTYVLLGQTLGRGGPMDPQTLDRYRKLLHILSKPVNGVSEAGRRGEANLFCIPVEREEHGTSTVFAGYDTDLADYFRDRFADTIRQEPLLAKGLSTRPGPFLISTLAPAGRFPAKESLMLLADLSDSKAAEMEEIVSAYNMQIRRETESDMMVYSLLRLRLFNVLPNTDLNLKIVRTR